MTRTARERTHLGKCVLMIVLQMTIVAGAHSQTPPPITTSKTTSADISQMSIEDLMNLEVTSGAKKEESLQRTTAAIFVITGEDIRRSGATNLPDVLRMVPGLEVAQISGNTWSVTSRGFGNAFVNKMLVLVDGRTVYSPVFSGVFWDAQDILLADVERIEVIRGPGAALWGTNAVNGVINIITKTAAKTQGATVTAAGGNVVGGYGAGQYGGKLPGSGFYRLYAKGFSTDSVPGALGQGPQDGWNLQHGGFRADWTLSPRDSLTVEGDLFRSADKARRILRPHSRLLVLRRYQGDLKITAAICWRTGNGLFRPSLKLVFRRITTMNEQMPGLCEESQTRWISSFNTI